MCFSDIEGNSTNKCIYVFSFLVGKHREPQSIKAKLFLPIIPIGIVAYEFTLLWDNLCRNSCIWPWVIDQVCSFKVAGYSPSSLSAWLDCSYIYIARRSQGPAILNEKAWSINDLLYGFRKFFPCGT